MRRIGAARPREQTSTETTSISNQILQSIPDAEYRLIRSHLEPFEFHQQEILHEPGRSQEFAYFPNRGLISTLVATEDGKTVEAGMVGNEGVVGVALAVGVTISPLRQLVEIAGDGFKMKAGAFQGRLKAMPHFQMILNRYAVIQGMQVAQTAACNRLHDAGQRMARWLLMAADRVDSTSLPITHDFLASILGTDRPSISLAAKILQRKGIIEYSRGTIEILNRKTLESSACECYRVIRHFDRLLWLK